MSCHGLFPNNPRSHCMCGLFPGHVNKSFARTALSGLPHGRNCCSGKNCMKPSTFLWAKCKSPSAALFPHSFEETHTRWLFCHAREPEIFSEGRKLTDWHRVSDSFIVWRGWATSAAPHQTTSKTPLWPSFPFLLSLSLRRWRWCSGPGLTEPCWLWQAGSRLSHSSLFSGSQMTAEEDDSTPTH